MSHARRLASSFAALFLSVTALAGGGTHIEINLSGVGDGTAGSTDASFNARVVLDADAAPTSDNGVIVGFAGVEAQLSGTPADTLFDAPGQTMSTTDGTLQITDVHWSVLSDELVIILETTGAAFLDGVTIRISSLDGFASGMTSLPGDPQTYLPEDTGMSATVESSTGVSGTISWTSLFGFSKGTMALNTRAFDPPPEPEGCSAVDIAEPFGMLDFSDVLAFLSAFGQGCP